MRCWVRAVAVWLCGMAEGLVTADFAVGKRYVYANDRPLLVADRDGRAGHIAVGLGLGALMGGGIEAVRQYMATGHIESWGRIATAAAGGAIAGSFVTA